ncbi:hypothetical protein ElyMa_000927900 [Elysia marginata]|uniref:Uncharacterized protein n=1 Tax=Elysia marginata TaxID=1093978 RepID=A0AAV4HAM2_9GAST|nr:hypothetical protein ElyMa_000927900 [Elysia marginata]
MWELSLSKSNRHGESSVGFACFAKWCENLIKLLSFIQPLGLASPSLPGGPEVKNVDRRSFVNACLSCFGIHMAGFFHQHLTFGETGVSEPFTTILYCRCDNLPLVTISPTLCFLLKPHPCK